MKKVVMILMLISQTIFASGFNIEAREVIDILAANSVAAFCFTPVCTLQVVGITCELHPGDSNSICEMEDFITKKSLQLMGLDAEYFQQYLATKGIQSCSEESSTCQANKFTCTYTGQLNGESCSVE